MTSSISAVDIDPLVVDDLSAGSFFAFLFLLPPEIRFQQLCFTDLSSVVLSVAPVIAARFLMLATTPLAILLVPDQFLHQSLTF